MRTVGGTWPLLLAVGIVLVILLLRLVVWA